MIRILFIGDIVGHDGLNFFLDHAPLLKRDIKFDFCIVNGENSDSGKGITKKQAEKLLQGNVLEGPCIVEERMTNVVIPPGFKMRVDEYGNYITAG